MPISKLPYLYHEGAELDAIAAISDALEVSPVHEEDGSCEVCEPADAHFWSVYLHYDVTKSENRGVDCIADFATEAEALAYARTFKLPVKGYDA